MTIVKCSLIECSNNDCGVCTRHIIELYEQLNYNEETEFICYHYKR